MLVALVDEVEVKVAVVVARLNETLPNWTDRSYVSCEYERLPKMESETYFFEDPATENFQIAFTAHADLSKTFLRYHEIVDS